MAKRLWILALSSWIAASAPGLAVTTAPPTAGSNVQIGSDTGVGSVAIDWEPANGYLFAVTRYSTGILIGDWKVFRSTDGGVSWSSTLHMDTDTSIVDAAVVDGYLYVAYAFGSEVRVRRASSTTGDHDDAYGYKTALDAAPAAIEEIALAVNSDDNDNTLWIFVLTDDGVIHARACTAASCTSFNDHAPGVSNARSGLAAAWNIGYNDGFAPSGVYVLFSYVTTGDEIRVVKRQNGVGWLASSVQWGATGSETTSLAAFRDRFAVVYEYPAVGGPDAKIAVSSDGGDGWSLHTFGDGSYTGGGYYTPMVSARSGSGLGVLVQWDRPTGDDSYWLGQVPNFTGAFQDWSIVNDHDFSYGPTTFWSDLQWMGAGWGVAYRCALNKAWFLWSPVIRYSGFEVAGFDEWSSATIGP